MSASLWMLVIICVRNGVYDGGLQEVSGKEEEQKMVCTFVHLFASVFPWESYNLILKL